MTDPTQHLHNIKQLSTINLQDIDRDRLESLFLSLLQSQDVILESITEETRRSTIIARQKDAIDKLTETVRTLSDSLAYLEGSAADFHRDQIMMLANMFYENYEKDPKQTILDMLVGIYRCVMHEMKKGAIGRDSPIATFWYKSALTRFGFDVDLEEAFTEEEEEDGGNGVEEGQIAMPVEEAADEVQ